MSGTIEKYMGKERKENEKRKENECKKNDGQWMATGLIPTCGNQTRGHPLTVISEV